MNESRGSVTNRQAFLAGCNTEPETDVRLAGDENDGPAERDRLNSFFTSQPVGLSG